jgi:hypothetical protein
MIAMPVIILMPVKRFNQHGVNQQQNQQQRNEGFMFALNGHVKSLK